MRDSEFRSNSALADSSMLIARGSAGLWAALGAVLAAALAIIAVVSAETSEPLILTAMAFLATLGVFFLLGLAAGNVRISERTTDADVVGALAQGFADGLCITTLDGRRVYANRAFEETLGRPAGGRWTTLESYFAGEPQAAEALFRLTRAATRGESRTEEFRVRGVLDGQRHSRWYRLSVSRLDMPRGRDELGPLVLWRIIDVSDDRRREADTLRSLEASLAQYESLPIGILSADEDGRIQQVNGMLADWLGLSTESLARGLHLADIASGDAAALLRLLSREVGEVPRKLEIDLIREDGVAWPATLVLLPRRAASGPAITAAVLARSHDEPASGAAQSTETRFARLFQSAPFGIAIVASNGRIVSSNAAFARLLLDGKGGQAGWAIDVLTRGVEPERRSEVEAALSEALAGKANVAPLEITVGEAREFTRRVFFSPLTRGTGAESAILYIIDVTEQKALEAKFAQSQKMEAVGKLAGGIAHDFNNVLTAIIGFSDLLLHARKPSDPGYRHIVNIKSSANRAAGLVSQLLAFSRRQTLKPEVIRLSEQLTDTAVLLNRLLGEKIELKILPGRDLWDVKADRTQLDQVIVNLAVNARDAMPDGGLLVIRTRNIGERESQRLESQGLPTGEYVLIEVEDNGQGMSPEVQAKIFEPFFTTKGVGKGTGLGLATVYGIVKQTGGYVFVESTVGQGTTFRIYLPRYQSSGEDELASETEARKERQDMTGTGRVLLVEDEDAVRGFASEALKRQGYEVLQATTGAEAIELMQSTEGKVDLVVSDVIMPEMDGPSMYNVLRATTPDLKIIFMSGYPDEAFKNALDPDAKFAFLQKPFSLAQLAAKVKEELAR
jgi:two-component system cell cycle sensor histidine kinase/response regulator CckA